MSRSKWLGIGIKLLLTIALFWVILRGCDWSAIRQRLAALSGIALIGILALIGFQSIVLTFRWRWITKCMGYDLSLRDGLMGQLISQFFNQGLPASLGADGVRIWWLTRIRVPLRQAVENVLFDRLAGFVTLLLLVQASLALLIGMTHDIGPVWSLTLISIAGLLGLVAVALPWRLGWVNSLQQSKGFLARLAGKVFYWLGEFRRLVLLVCQSRRGLMRVLGSSISVHLLSVVLGFFIAVQLRVHVTFLQCLAAMLPALLVAYLPLSIAGWGVREGAMIVGFGLVGVPRVDALVLSVTLGLGYLFVALAGGLVWLVGGFSRVMVKQA